MLIDKNAKGEKPTTLNSLTAITLSGMSEWNGIKTTNATDKTNDFFFDQLSLLLLVDVYESLRQCARNIHVKIIWNASLMRLCKRVQFATVNNIFNWRFTCCCPFSFWVFSLLLLFIFCSSTVRLLFAERRYLYVADVYNIKVMFYVIESNSHLIMYRKTFVVQSRSTQTNVCITFIFVSPRLDMALWTLFSTIFRSYIFSIISGEMYRCWRFWLVHSIFCLDDDSMNSQDPTIKKDVVGSRSMLSFGNAMCLCLQRQRSIVHRTFVISFVLFFNSHFVYFCFVYFFLLVRSVHFGATPRQNMYNWQEIQKLVRFYWPSTFTVCCESAQNVETKTKREWNELEVE